MASCATPVIRVWCFCVRLMWTENTTKKFYIRLHIVLLIASIGYIFIINSRTIQKKMHYIALKYKIYCPVL